MRYIAALSFILYGFTISLASASEEEPVNGRGFLTSANLSTSVGYTAPIVRSRSYDSLLDHVRQAGAYNLAEQNAGLVEMLSGETDRAATLEAYAYQLHSHLQQMQTEILKARNTCTQYQANEQQLREQYTLLHKQYLQLQAQMGFTVERVRELEQENAQLKKHKIESEANKLENAAEIIRAAIPDSPESTSSSAKSPVGSPTKKARQAISTEYGMDTASQVSGKGRKAKPKRTFQPKRDRDGEIIRIP